MQNTPMLVLKNVKTNTAFNTGSFSNKKITKYR